MMRSKGLGRGLDALLGGAADTTERLQTLDISSMQPGRYQPRTRMDEASLAELADSIRAQGVMQPILVRPLGVDRYEIIAGERRWRASRMAGLAQVPVVIREVPDEAALAMALIENIQREDLNPLEEATGIQRLVDEFKLTHQAAAEAVGRSRSAVTNLLRLLTLAPPVQQMLADGAIDMGHARALLPLSHARQVELAHRIAEKGLSVREAENLVRRLERAPRAKRQDDADTRRLQEELAQRLGAKVSIRHSGRGSGRLVIEYSSLDHLDAILAHLK